MARDRGEYYSGLDASQPRGQLGALMNLQGSGGGEAPSISQLQQPQAAPEEAKQRNAQWLQDPRTQAALATFAMGIMQPLGANADSSDFMGLLANSMGNATRAAAGVEQASLEQQAALAKLRREEAEFGLKLRADDRAERQFERQNEQFEITEGRLTRAENRELLQLQLDAKEKRLTREQEARKTALEEKKAMVGALKTDAEIGKIEAETEKTRAETKKLGNTKASRVISGKDELNSLFNLGLQPDQQARVVIESDEEGRIIGASIEGSFGNQPEPSPLAKLQRDREAAINAGKTKEAAEIQRQIDDITTAGATASGVQTMVDPNNPSLLTQRVIPGGKTELEMQEAQRQRDEQEKAKQQQAHLVVDTIDQSIDLIASHNRPDLTITGFGSYLSLIPTTDAKTLNENLGTIKANIGFDKLQEMRENSPTGGALGPVSDFENKLLQAVFGSLNQAQNGQQLVNNMHRIRMMYNDIINVGQLSTLAKQVETGTLSEAQALQQAKALFGDFEPGNTTEPAGPAVGEPADPLAEPPAYLSEEDKRLWQYYGPEDRLLILKTYPAGVGGQN